MNISSHLYFFLVLFSILKHEVIRVEFFFFTKKYLDYNGRISKRFIITSIITPLGKMVWEGLNNYSWIIFSSKTRRFAIHSKLAVLMKIALFKLYL